MIIQVKINGEINNYTVNSSIPLYKSITEIREKIKKQFGNNTKIWFINIIKNKKKNE
mgnify:CR=1 FL=1